MHLRTANDVILVASKSPGKAKTAEQELVTKPEEYDILCGKDKTYGKHTGNQVYRALIESWVPRYQEATSKQSKMKITREIVSSMRAKYNSRFLRRASNDEWELISDQVARDKVSHALRFAANGAKCTAAKKRKATTSHHRRPSSTTSELSECSHDSTGTADVHGVDSRERDLVQEMFMRQQAILRGLNKEDDYDAEIQTLNAHIRVSNGGAALEADFTSSADLSELLNEPLMDGLGDCDLVMELTR